MSEPRGRWVVGVSGASGARYALRLLDVLSTAVAEVHVVISESALRVLSDEENIKVSASALSPEVLIGRPASNIIFHNPRDIGASIASGSFRCSGMIIIPCSMATLGFLAHGIANNLLHRAADVTLKEGRKLVVVPRETPLSAIHLENMLTLSRAGAAIVPAMPGFYHRPKEISELIDMMVMKVLDVAGIPIDLVARWGEGQKGATKGARKGRGSRAEEAWGSSQESE